jgi:hypothetical protein
MRDGVGEILLGISLYQNFSNKCAMSFRQSGNICRARPAKISASRQILPTGGAPGNSSPDRFFRRRTKSMFKRI